MIKAKKFLVLGLTLAAFPTQARLTDGNFVPPPPNEFVFIDDADFMEEDSEDVLEVIPNPGFLPNVANDEDDANNNWSDDDSSDEIRPRPNKIPRQIHESPLEQAARNNNLEFILHLITFQGFIIDQQNEVGGTALHAAVTANQIEAVALLLELGADRTIRNEAGETPFEKARTYGFNQIANLLNP